MNTNNFDVLAKIHQILQDHKLQKQASMIRQAGVYKSAAQPPMGAAPGGAPGGMPMDPSMGMPVDPNTGMPIDPNTGMPIDPNTGMPMDPSMMMGAAGGGMPPAPPAAPPAADPAAADPAAAAAAAAPAEEPAAAPKKLKPDEYMAKLDTRYYNLQILVTAIAKKLGVELPPEALITPTIDQEQSINIDNPTPQIMDLGNSPEAAPEELPPEMAAAMGGGDMGGETPKTASYRKSANDRKVNEAVLAKLRHYYRMS